MRLRAIPFATSAAVLLASSLATAQPAYERERRREVPMDEMQTRDAMRREVVVREPAPPRVLSSADVAAVEQRRDKVLQRDMVGRKLGAADYQELRRQRSEVDALIARMRAGHPVSSESIDRALGLYDQDRPGY